MSEEQSNFKVTDRRLFNPDGSPREVAAEERSQEVPLVSEVKPESSGPATGQTSSAESHDIVDATYSEPSPAGAEPAEHGHEIPGADDPASFPNFIMSIASNAASALGMMEHPVTGKREVDLELGKHWIDILGMLQQKTRNNLMAQEQQILESLLADLRMQYVSLTNAVASKARSFSSRDITGG